MRALNSEGRYAGAEPGDAVLAVIRIVDRRRARRRCEETQLVEGHAIERGKENLAQAPVGQRVPDLASRARRCTEGQLSAGAPHRRRPGASWCLHRTLSMESG